MRSWWGWGSWNLREDHEKNMALNVGSGEKLTAAWLAQLEERQSAEREVAGSNPGRTNTQGL